MKRYTCAWWWPPLNFLRWPLPLPPPFFVRPGLRFIFAFLWIFLSPPCAIPGARRYRPSEGSSQLARSLRVGLCSLKSVALTGTRCARHRARSSRRCRADPKVRNAPSWSTTAAACSVATGHGLAGRRSRREICDLPICRDAFWRRWCCWRQNKHATTPGSQGIGPTAQAPTYWAATVRGAPPIGFAIGGCNRKPAPGAGLPRDP